MSTAPLTEDGDITFELGMDSNTEPGKLVPGRYARSMNMLNRGGILQCRPGYRCLMALPAGRIQGFFLFRPKAGPEILLIGVAGRLYTSEYPFNETNQVAGVQFDEFAARFYFEQVEQAIVQNPDGSLTFIKARNLVIIQDGAHTLPAVYDGSGAEHTNDIPMGGPMKWIADRLWVAQGAKLFASDINNPVSFVEDQYLATIKNFILPAEITALASLPNAEAGQLLAFTEETLTVFQAGVRDRTLWASTPDFQKMFLPNIGCKAERSLKVHYGLLYWWSSFGLTSLDAAMNAKQTSRLPYRDAEMVDSKARLSDDMSGVAVGSFENYLMVSVPHADLYNRHTWVLDNSVRQNLTQDSPPVWNSYWTGTRPVEWITAEIRGRSRVLYLSPDYDGVNRLWEAFTPDRKDEGCPITWWAETRAYYGSPSLLNRHKKFRYAEIALTELAGDVDISVSVAGATRGRYKNILTKRIKATEGIFRPGMEITMDTELFGLKKQSRILRSEDFINQNEEDSLNSCHVESRYPEFYDRSFQLLIVGSGPGAIEGLTTFFELPTTADHHLRDVDCDDDETAPRMVRFDGGATEADDEATGQEVLSEALVEFTSTRTATYTRQNTTRVGSGASTSTISQDDADKVAQAIANRRAAHDLEDALPQIVSLGDSANR